MEFDVHGAYFAFEVTYFIFFLFDEDSELGDGILKRFNFFSIPFVLVLQLSEEMICLLLQVLNHKFFLFLCIYYEVLLLVASLQRVHDVVVVIRHDVELELYFLDILLQDNS